MSSPRDPSEELAETLRQLLGERRISGSRMARELGEGFSQSKVSRILTGRLNPTPPDARRMLSALPRIAPDHPDVPGDIADRVMDLAYEIDSRRGVTPLRVAFTTGSPASQRRFKLLDEHAERVATFHPAMVPALLQCRAYMEHMIRSAGRPEADVQRWLAEREARQQFRATRPAIQLVSYGALCWAPGGPDVMAQQCDHIAQLTLDRPTWTIGVIPRLVPADAPVDYPPNGFDLYDETAVEVGTTAGNARVTDEKVVRSHVARLGRLQRLAVYDSAARQVLGELADEYRAMAR